VSEHQQPPVYTVSQLNRLARQLLEQELPAMWVSGEISNLARPASGHIYFTLKDEQAQIRCALFRGRNRGLGFTPGNGQQVLVRGRISIYEPRGDYQLVAEHMEAAGEGLLRIRFEALKQKLAAEGLFEAARKRKLPLLPARIGVITSPSGAAIRDILHILQRRFPAVPVIIYPTPVQGEQARHEIVRALQLAGERAECDVLILARGGGSLEDLWAFNEEIVVRAIAASPLPVISGVGHETDFTLTDLVADVRAPTPSGAAELVVPDAREWRRRLATITVSLGNAVRRSQLQTGIRLDQLERRLGRSHPGLVLRQHHQRLDELRQRLASGIRRQLKERELGLARFNTVLARCSPASWIALRQQQVAHSQQRLANAIRQSLGHARQQLAVLAAGLQGVSPLKTLERGYALVQDSSGQLIRTAGQLRSGDQIHARLARGSFSARVETIHQDEQPDADGPV